MCEQIKTVLKSHVMAVTQQQIKDTAEKVLAALCCNLPPAHPDKPFGKTEIKALVIRAHDIAQAFHDHK